MMVCVGETIAVFEYRSLASPWFRVMVCNIRTTGKSNQKNVGTIKSANLCTDIEYSALDQTAVCNLASLGPSHMFDLQAAEDQDL